MFVFVVLVAHLYGQNVHLHFFFNLLSNDVAVGETQVKTFGFGHLYRENDQPGNKLHYLRRTCLYWQTQFELIERINEYNGKLFHIPNGLINGTRRFKYSSGWARLIL